MKHTHDYDNVFKTMKHRHKRLFISVINETFGKNYPLDSEIEVLPSEGYLTEEETQIGEKNIEERLVNVMGGTVIESESERLVRVGKEEGISEGISIGEEKGIRSLVESCQEFGLSVTDAVKKLISKFGLTESESLAKANKYWK